MGCQRLIIGIRAKRTRPQRLDYLALEKRLIPVQDIERANRAGRFQECDTVHDFFLESIALRM